MKVSIFDYSPECVQIGEFECSHISMFQKDSTINIHFNLEERANKFIALCVREHVLIKVHGTTVTLLHESNNYQRVRFRFDS